MTEKEKYYLIDTRLRKAEESFLIAEEMSIEHPNFSINRFYYSLFYAISALLLNIDTDAKTHKGLITEFNKHFVKTGIFSREEGRLFVQIFQWRTKGDYDDFTEFTAEDINKIREPIKTLIEKIKKHLS